MENQIDREAVTHGSPHYTPWSTRRSETANRIVETRRHLQLEEYHEERGYTDQS